MTEPTTVHSTIVLERTYDASPARVFNSWADPDSHRRWFVEGEGWEIGEYVHDFRVGGHEHGRFRQTGDATVYVNDTRYQDIVPDRRIVFAYTMARGEDRFSASLATIELLPAGGGTKLVFTEQIAIFDDGDKVEYREQGWNELLDKLGAELSRGAMAA